MHIKIHPTYCGGKMITHIKDAPFRKNLITVQDFFYEH